ncbi:MAG: gliding motility-associated C-terminal domain-containing protein, partial [Bacteroidetes bacterium]|nr:gliding motility-associated C-terminal domain-containing protein [Bacteroidota bacterium]
TLHTNVNGCDSTHTVYTSLLASDSTFSTATSCLPADTGYLTTLHTNVNGCDSTHTVYTSLLASDSTFVNASSCNPADTGFVTTTYSNINGCDSIHTVTTTLISLPSDSLTFSLCPYELPFTLADGSTINDAVSNYVVVVPNTSGCDSMITYTINIANNVSVNPTYVVALSGDSIEFVIENGTNTVFSYESSDGVDCQNCTNYFVYPSESNTNYFFTLTDTLTGCIFNDTMHIDLEYYSELNIPNIFTPNGDGQNDVFRCYGKDIVQYQLEIFDRWGGRIFNTEEITEGWDGVFNNLPAVSGVYIAVIRASGKDGQQWKISKNIKLVR